VGRSPTGFSALPSAQPFEISLALRETSWKAYRVRFDTAAVAWVANVIDWSMAACSGATEADTAVIDGEAVWCDDAGIAAFEGAH
jgi:hypothetical protein